MHRIPSGPAGDGQGIAAAQAGRERCVGNVVVMFRCQGAGVFDNGDLHPGSIHQEEPDILDKIITLSQGRDRNAVPLCQGKYVAAA